MALYPRAIQKLIEPGPTDPRVDVMVGTVGHVAVSMADSLHDWFDGPSGGVESHFYIRLSGVVEQYRDTAYEADAQGGGNSWISGGKRYGFISYETEGMGSGEWSAAQLASIKELILWGESVHHYPMVKATNPHGPGHGYHALFDEWNRDHHACPGTDRIKQFNNVLVPWLATGRDEDEVTPDDIKAIAKATADEMLKRPVKDLAGNELTVGKAIGITLRNTGYIAELEKASIQQVADAVAAKVGPGASADDIAKALLVQLATKETP